MFLASFEKLFLLAGIIAVVWYGFRFVGASSASGPVAGGPSSRPGSGPLGGRGTANARSTSTNVANVEETIRCRACGAFVPARQPLRCGRADCPFPA